MSSPESIEIAWGGGRWNGGHKRAVRPVLEAAASLAQEGLEYVDISWELPKSVTVWQANNRIPDAGAAVDAQNFELWLPYNLVKRRKIASRFVELMLTVSHEITHCARFEFADADDIVERAASEGIAYHAEASVGEALLEYNVLPPPMSQQEVAVLSACFFEDAALAEASSSEFQDEMIDHWFSRAVGQGGFMTAGDMIGITAVGRHLDSGVTFPELMVMDAQDVMSSLV